jgi:alginate O-acetyltransferase complex protein AlgI
LLLYFITPKKYKNLLLLASSLFFYFFGEPIYVLLLLLSSVSDWLHSLYIENHRNTKGAKRALISSIIINLAMLGFFKYADFFIGTVNAIFKTSIPLTNVPLPIGISFFTFQTMSCTIDVYRGKAHAQKSFISFATFVCLFPQLIAGPIVRYTDISEELNDRTITVSGVASGLSRFVCGLGKKVLIANILGEIATVFRDSGDASVLFYWLYALSFTLQIYFDFSGYSDMAIGLGRVLGFSFPENFDYPLISRSITEFWRRWHMTLGQWFRDYVYIPLGGNRTSRLKWLRNIAVVWLLTGLWHGAEWNFVLWGGIFGVLLIIEKLWLGKVISRLPRVFSHIYTIIFIVLSFVIFNADGLSGVVNDLGGLFGAGGIPLVNFDSVYYLKSYLVSIIIAIIGCTPLPKMLWQKLPNKAVSILEPVLVSVVLIVSTAFIINGSYNPFLYFRF